MRISQTAKNENLFSSYIYSIFFHVLFLCLIVSLPFGSGGAGIAVPKWLSVSLDTGDISDSTAGLHNATQPEIAHDADGRASAPRAEDDKSAMSMRKAASNGIEYRTIEEPIRLNEGHPYIAFSDTDALSPMSEDKKGNPIIDNIKRQKQEEPLEKEKKDSPLDDSIHTSLDDPSEKAIASLDKVSQTDKSNVYLEKMPSSIPSKDSLSEGESRKSFRDAFIQKPAVELQSPSEIILEADTKDMQIAQGSKPSEPRTPETIENVKEEVKRVAFPVQQKTLSVPEPERIPDAKGNASSLKEDGLPPILPSSTAMTETVDSVTAILPVVSISRNDKDKDAGQSVASDPSASPAGTMKPDSPQSRDIFVTAARMQTASIKSEKGKIIRTSSKPDRAKQSSKAAKTRAKSVSDVQADPLRQNREGLSWAPTLSSGARREHPEDKKETGTRQTGIESSNADTIKAVSDEASIMRQNRIYGSGKGNAKIESPLLSMPQYVRQDEGDGDGMSVNAPSATALGKVAPSGPESSDVQSSILLDQILVVPGAARGILNDSAITVLGRSITSGMAGQHRKDQSETATSAGSKFTEDRRGVRLGALLPEVLLPQDIQIAICLQGSGLSSIFTNITKKPYPVSSRKTPVKKEETVKCTVNKNNRVDSCGIRYTLSVAKAEKGQYSFVIENRGKEGYDADVLFHLYKGRSNARIKEYKKISLPSGAELRFKFLLPDAIFWDDDVYSAQIEDSKFITKVQQESGLIWSEEKESLVPEQSPNSDMQTMPAMAIPQQ